jgi:hypothetical protein
MGLDQFAYKIINYIPESSIGFESDFNKQKYEDLYYWRKNYNLQTWMEELYRAKGGRYGFNCKVLLLTMDDIKNLEQWLNENKDEEDEDEDEDKENEITLSFCELAIDAINNGYTIIYNSCNPWW